MKGFAFQNKGTGVVERGKDSSLVTWKQANLHGPNVTWNKSNGLMLNKQLIQWRKR